MDNSGSGMPNPPAEQEPAQSPAVYHQPSNKRARRTWLLIAAVSVLILTAGAVYFYLKQKPAHKNQPAATTQQTVQPDTVGTSTSQQYTAAGKDLNLTFTYPSTWTAAPPSNTNDNDQPITVTSPLVELTNAGGSSITGKVVVKIRPGASQLSELSDASMAAITSTQIAYDKPTSVQHQYPYLTFIRLSGGANPQNAFEEVMITGIASFTKGQALSPTSLGQLDPVVSAEFFQCTTQTCGDADATPIGMTQSTWENNDAAKQALSIFQSLELH